MKYRTLTYLSALLLLALEVHAQSDPNLPPPPSGQTWQKVLDDEFTQDKVIDPAMWQIGPSHYDDVDNSCLLHRIGDITLDSTDGMLSKVDNNGNKGYTGNGKSYEAIDSFATTRPGYWLTYGYAEYMTQFPTTMVGAWPTLWMEQYGTWPPEFDVLEYRGPSADGSGGYPWGDVAVIQAYGPVHLNETGDFYGQYHAWGVDWEPGSVTFYVDGQKTHSYSGSKVPTAAMYAIINGGAYCGHMNGVGLPSYLHTKYFRWYQLSATAAPGASTLLQANPLSDQINLSWEEPAGSPTGYYVQRATTSRGPYTTIATLNSPVPTLYTDKSVTPGTAYYYVVTAFNSKGSGPASPEISAFTAPAMLIGANAGGSAISGSGWTGDSGFSGGKTTSTSASIYTANTLNPAPVAVYQTNRYGNMTYTANGLIAGAPYHVRLHFAETYWDCTDCRTFNVAINGTQVLTNFDINYWATGKNTAVIKDFNTTANNSGQIVIGFTSVKDNAQINGIEIDPALPPFLEINAAGDTIPGTSWIADTYVSGGSGSTSSNSIDTSEVTNPAPEEVYQSQRYGNMTYTINGLAPGVSYNLRLHFAETYWNCTGCRVFNVAINGKTVLTNFDIFAAAGGENIANVQQFSAKSSAPYGAITIQFTNVTDNAAINGIEVDQNESPAIF